MDIGVAYPQTENCNGGHPVAVGDFGRAVEDLGFAHILSYDQCSGRSMPTERRPFLGPYTERDPFHDPFVMFGYPQASPTNLLHNGHPGPSSAPDRFSDRQASDLELVFGGRLARRGPRRNYVEYKALGQDYTRGALRQEEQIGLLHRLFTEPVVESLIVSIE